MSKIIVTTRSSILGAAILLFSGSGCATVRITDKSANDEGLLYYPPKPYLLITKNVNVAAPSPPAAEKKAEEKSSKNEDKSAALVDVAEREDELVLDKLNLSALIRTPTYGVQVLFLPDLAKPQRVKMSAGIGTVDTTFGFVNGWQLNALNIKLNSQVPETIDAIGGALTAGAALFPAPSAAEAGGSRLEALAQLIGALKGAPAPTEAGFKEWHQENGSIKTAIISLLNSLQRELEPRVWLFEIIDAGDKAGVQFKRVNGVFPFSFQ